MADDNLVRREGVIGASHLPTETGHLHAQALKGSTEQILGDLAAPRVSMPTPSRTSKPKSREAYAKLLPKILPKVEMMAADGASDEQLTLHLLCKGQMKNLLLQSKDLVHATRRIANRTCFADGYLKKLCLD